MEDSVAVLSRDTLRSLMTTDKSLERSSRLGLREETER